MLSASSPDTSSRFRRAGSGSTIVRRKSEDGRSTCDEEHSSQIHLLLKLRYKENTHKCTELPNPGGDAVPRRAHAHGKDLGRHDEGRRVRSELGKEVAESENGQERRNGGGEGGERPQDDEAQRHHAEPDELQATVTDAVHLCNGQQVARQRKDHKDAKGPYQLRLEACMRRNFLQNAREREGVAVVRVVEEKPRPSRPGEQQQHASVAEELAKSHAPSPIRDGVGRVDRAARERMQLLGGAVRLALDSGLEPGGLRHLGP